MKISQKDIEEAARVLGPMDQDEPTEEQFEGFRRWTDERGLGPATAMALYERVILLIRQRQKAQHEEEWRKALSELASLDQDRLRRNRNYRWIENVLATRNAEPRRGRG